MGSNEPQSDFRRDIQGLRAIAVTLVVVYHFGLGLPGGFLGVDIFLVISGFVITQLLMREIGTTGSINLGRFFRRRFLRLAPALAVMVFIVAFASFFVLAPSPRQSEILWTAIGATFGLANVVIERVSGGYFGSAPETNILVHTWSLGVEWQFYLFLPLLFIFGLFLSRNELSRRGGTLISLVAVVSLISFLLASLPSFPGIDGTVAAILGFYSPVSRAWEFGAGALAFFLAERIKKNEIQINGLQVIGAIALILGVSAGNPSTFIPSFDALWVVGGTFLLLLHGPGWRLEQVLERLLSSRILSGLGDRSYSIYLWHWPIAYLLSELGPVNHFATLGIIILGLSLIELSYRFLENPFRRGGAAATQSPKRFVVPAFLLPAVLLVGALPLTSVLDNAGSSFGLWRIQHPGDTGHDRFHEYVEAEFHPCTPEQIRADALRWRGFLRCQQSQETGPIDFAIVGDSHAEHLFLGLAEAFPTKNVVYYISTNLPIRGQSEQMTRILDHVSSDEDISLVLITSYWAGRGLPADKLEVVVHELIEGGKQVVLTNDVPDFPNEPWRCQSIPLFSIERHTLDDPCENLTPAPKRNAFSEDLREIASQVPGTTIIDTYGLFCDDSRCAMTDPNGNLLYRDPHHLNLNGSRFVSNAISKSVRELIGSEQEDPGE